MRKFGICLESIDFTKKPEFVDKVLKIVKDGTFDFVQLIVIPHSYNDNHAIVEEKMKDIRTVIHAPYRPQEIDVGNKDAFENNINNLKDSQKFADLLHADIIVLHSGVGDDEEHLCETIRQFRMINDPRITVENLPYNPHGYRLCGATPENIKRIIDETNCKFCFDFAHAICAANSLERNFYDDFAEYNALNPVLYHLSDGDSADTTDEHLHLGLGNQNIKRIIQDFTFENSPIVLETRYSNPTIVEHWIKDMEYIENLVER